MEHPELFLIPALMLADYYLTLVSAQAAKRYREHLRSPEFELNPIWQKSIRERSWFNPRHLSGVVLVAAFLYLVQSLPIGDFGLFELVFGMLLGAIGAVIGRHISNLAQFRYMNAHPDAMSGQAVVKQEAMLAFSRWQHLGAGVPILLLAIVTGNLIVIGAAMGVLVLALAHFFWGALGRRKQPRPAV